MKKAGIACIEMCIRDRSKSIEFKRSKKLALRRKLLRQKQVRRQKLFLAGALLLLATVFVILFSNQKPNEYLTINEACEAYRPDVEQAAASYGMSDYVDLILALMMPVSYTHLTVLVNSTKTSGDPICL